MEEVADVHAVLGAGEVLGLDVVEQLDFGAGLVGVLLVVLDDLQGHLPHALVVEALEDLPEGALPQDLQDLVAEVQLVALGPVVGAVGLGEAVQCGPFLLAVLAVVVDL